MSVNIAWGVASMLLPAIPPPAIPPWPRSSPKCSKSAPLKDVDEGGHPIYSSRRRRTSVVAGDRSTHPATAGPTDSKKTSGRTSTMAGRSWGGEQDKQACANLGDLGQVWPSFLWLAKLRQKSGQIGTKFYLFPDPQGDVSLKLSILLE